ncbi:MAG: hypothetical protein JXQ90_14625 [Cyclobacteriaceae bacterium]
MNSFTCRSIPILISILLIGCADAGKKPKADSLPKANVGWIKIDDFESIDPLSAWTLVDTRNDTDPRIENPQVTAIRSGDSDNHYLIKKPAAEGVVGNRKALSYRALPVAVQLGEIFTFYARVKVEYFPNNHVFGLSNLEPDRINEHDYNALEPSLRVTDKFESNGYKNDGTLMVRKDDGYAKIRNIPFDRDAKALETGKWYEVWFVVDNRLAAVGGQTYDVYLSGGSEFPEQKLVYEGADFRMKREQPLGYFLTNCNTGPVEAPYGNGGLIYDDLYMKPGVDLSEPSQTN